jgi:hypothetical protein
MHFFTADMSFNRETSLMLADEINNQKENLAIIIRFIEAGDDDGSDTETRVFADAIVDLWVMIEDSCSIVRQVLSACSFRRFNFKHVVDASVLRYLFVML